MKSRRSAIGGDSPTSTSPFVIGGGGWGVSLAFDGREMWTKHQPAITVDEPLPLSNFLFLF